LSIYKNVAYLFLWEGSPEPDYIAVGRQLFHRRLETPPTICFHVFCEIAIFQQNLGKIFTGVFPNLILFKTLNIQREVILCLRKVLKSLLTFYVAKG